MSSKAAWGPSVSTELNAPVDVVYRTWLDGRLHAAMTGKPATGRAEVGAPFTALGGTISGTNVELVSRKKIVQTWCSTEFRRRSGVRP
jgi:Activator of Hsp90 ATPase homolog 1-like protein